MNEKIKQLLSEAQSKLSEAASLCEGSEGEYEEEEETEEAAEPVNEKFKKAAIIIAAKNKGK